MTHRFARIASIAVALVCVGWSVLIFTGNAFASLHGTQRFLFAGATMLYGVYRLVLGLTRRNQE